MVWVTFLPLVIELLLFYDISNFWYYFYHEENTREIVLFKCEELSWLFAKWYQEYWELRGEQDKTRHAMASKKLNEELLTRPVGNLDFVRKKVGLGWP